MANFWEQAQALARKQGMKQTVRKAQKWLQEEINNISRGFSRREIIAKGDKSDPLPQIGHMYFYFYDPKHKKTLPYYDQFPLTIVLERYSDGFLGLNLHYLPPVLRGYFMSKLLELASDSRFDENTKLRMTYRLMKNVSRYREYRPCVKRYLYSHMRSRPVKVPSNSWMSTVYLPVASFKKQNEGRIWSESRRKIR